MVDKKNIIDKKNTFLSSRLRYKMRLGNENLNTGANSEHEIERSVKQIFRHPLYKSNQVYYDVGLAIADRRIEFTDFIRPICLPST